MSKTAPTAAELQAQLTAANQQIETLKQQNETLNERNKNLSEKVDDYRTRSMNASDHIRDMQEELDAAQDRIADLEAEKNHILVHNLDTAFQTLTTNDTPSASPTMTFGPQKR